MDVVKITDRVKVPFWTKINPLWWLVGPDGWDVPEINNGEPYLPDVKSMWLRRFYWFFCRNPLMNFVGYVVGIEDRNAKVYGSRDVMATTLRDASPRRTGFNWAVSIPDRISGAALFIYAAIWVIGSAFPFSYWPVVCFAALFAGLKVAGPLPYIGWYGQIGSMWVEAYLGWRPASGGFGIKLVKRDD